GVNLPLLHAEQLIGVLGITGAPDTVRPYAELVRMAAEMLVEQRQLQAERHWQRHQLETWLRQLADTSVGLAQLAAEAERIGLQLGWPRQLVLLELTEEGDPSRALAALAGKAEQCGPLGARQLLLCRTHLPGRDDAAWLTQLDGRGLNIRRMLLSDALHDLSDLREAALALRDLQAYAQARKPAGRLLRLEEQRLQALLHGRRHDWSLQRWLAPLRRVLAQDPQGQLRQTLLAWCRHDGHPQACADDLGIHRNTLRYRLERIAELSGLDMTRRDQRLLFTLGLDLLDE
ncbi:MAG TPA: helix-turn-helix domain-containing protein, partial [Pseudomonas sp.]|nr:helix-turn-helix domain-containing protein [Pseudomonas sp.]